jgi:multidrug transporter EmrE-like cation transporter
MKLFPFLLLFSGGIVLTIGDIVMKEWVKNNQLLFYVLGLFIYLIGLIFLSQSFKFKNIAVASILLVLFNVITLTIVSIFFFKEAPSLKQGIGIALGLVAATLLELS